MSNGDFRDYLKLELARRSRKNPRYSLRAFSQALGIEPSALSKILNGKRRLTRPIFDRLAERLSLSPTLRNRFGPKAPLARSRRLGSSPIVVSKYQKLSDDMFEIISDWQHFAILELLNVDTFEPNERWISRALQISQAEASLAIERLQRTGILRVDANGQWFEPKGGVAVGGDTYTSAALQKLQRQVLEKSLVALREIPRIERDHSSMTMAIDSRKLPLARAVIKKFRRELCEVLKGDAPPRDQVFNLAVSLYPVTNLKPKKG